MTEEDIEKKRRLIVLRCFDEGLTKRRMIQVVIFGSIYLFGLVWIGFFLENIHLLAIMSIVYLLLTMGEKVGYGFGVLVYKSIIRLLLTDNDALERYRKLFQEKELVPQAQETANQSDENAGNG